MKSFAVLAALIISISGMGQKSIHEFKVEGLQGDEIDFAEFKGKMILVVNTASECGYTPQYEQLQDLHVLMGDRVAIVGFPANNFGGQEPGSNDQIASFCKKNYGVTFPMAAKVSVKGEDQHELFKWLTTQQNPDYTGDIQWNFEKFLLNEEGVLIKRFRTGTDPLSEQIINLL